MVAATLSKEAPPPPRHSRSGRPLSPLSRAGPLRAQRAAVRRMAHGVGRARGRAVCGSNKGYPKGAHPIPAGDHPIPSQPAASLTLLPRAAPQGSGCPTHGLWRPAGCRTSHPAARPAEPPPAEPPTAGWDGPTAGWDGPTAGWDEFRRRARRRRARRRRAHRRRPSRSLLQHLRASRAGVDQSDVDPHPIPRTWQAPHSVHVVRMKVGPGGGPLRQLVLQADGRGPCGAADDVGGGAHRYEKRYGGCYPK